MDPLLIIQAVLAAVTAAPKVEALVISAKDFILQLSRAGLINKETQNSTDAFVDAIHAMAKQGIVPPAWVVRPDPTLN